MENSELLVLARQSDISSSGVSWGAVIAGAFVAAALSLLLLALGAGLGLSAISPWSNIGGTVSKLGTIAIIWLILIQILASAMGGYLAGRLRTRWQSIHGDEVHFRDTANGLVAWAVGVVITVAFLTTAATAMAGGTVTATSGIATPPDYRPDLSAYFVDRLLRPAHPSATDPDLLVAEADRTFDESLRTGSASDANYLAELIATKTGRSPDDAARQVSQAMVEARQMEDNTRKATAHSLLWIFIALLIGAFCASYAATIGGRQRDHVQLI